MALPLRDDTPPARTPWVTYALILTCTVVLLFLQPPPFQRGIDVLDGNDEARAVLRYEYRWGAVPCEVAQGRSLADGARCDAPSAVPKVSKSVWLALVTSLFLHANLIHLAGNMLFLWVFGGAVEERLGRGLFLLVYLTSGVVGTLVHTVFHADQAVPVLGASGAIAGIMGAYLVLRPRGRILTVMTSAAVQVVYVPAFVVLGLFFVTQFLTPDAEHVAWQAHVGGMLAGAAFALGLRAVLDRRRRPPVAPVLSR